jgi:hypothetical protein
MRRSSATRKPTRLAAALLCAALSWLAAPASAETALVDLEVNGESRGTIELELDQSGEPIYSSAFVRSMLSGVAKSSIVDAIAARQRNVRSDELAAVGVLASYDKSSLSLAVAVDPESMKTETIGLSRQAQQGKGEIEVANAALALTLGLKLDYSPSYSWGSSGTGMVASDLSLGLSPSIRAFGLVAEGSGSLDYSLSGLDYSVDSAQAILDFPALGARLRGGIVDANAQSFQASKRLYGLSFATEQSLPGAPKKRASLDEQLLLRHDADIVVEVNGVALKRQRLRAGSYRFSDLPLSSGLNDVSLVIREDGEQPRVVKLGISFDSSLLGPGEADYALSFGSLGLDALAPYGAARFAIGLTRSLQIGANAEAGAGAALGGLSALAATGLGNLGIEGALSSGITSQSSSPFSFAARGFWRFSRTSDRYVPQFGLAAEYRAPGFSAPGSGSSATGDTWLFSAQASESLPGGIGSVALSGQGKLVETEIESWSATLGLNFSLGRSAFVSLAGGSDWSAASSFSPRAALTLTLAPRNSSSISYNQSYANGVDGESLAIGLPAGRGSVNFYGQGLAVSGADRSLDLSLAERSKEASITGSGHYFSSADGSDSMVAGRLSFASTLAFADWAFAATSSPSPALAILAPARGLRGQLVELRPIGGGLFESDAGQSAMVNGLTPYAPYVAGIELPESPPEARPYPSSVAIAPEYRSIAVLRVGVAPSISVRGRLVSADGEAVTNLSGGFISDSGESLPLSGTFTDESGVFECYGLAPGAATIRWDDGSVSSIVVPESEAGAFVDLGDIVSHNASSHGGEK